MKKVVSLLLLALACLSLIACGSSDNTTTTNPSSGGEGAPQQASGKANPAPSEKSGAAGGEKSAQAGGGETLQFEADPNGALAFTSDTATAKAGNVKIDFNNPQALPHDVVIEDSAGENVAETEEVASGSASATANLKPGTYTFYCSVPGHREAGMEGTLTVE